MGVLTFCLQTLPPVSIVLVPHKEEDRMELPLENTVGEDAYSTQIG